MYIDIRLLRWEKRRLQLAPKDTKWKSDVSTKFSIYRVYQNDLTGFEVDYIHKYGEQNYKY